MLRRQLLLAMIALVPFSSGYAQDVPFSPSGIASLTGRDICTLQGEFPKTMGVYLDHQKRNQVQSRERDGIVAVFLLSKPSSRNCGLVDAALDLTPLIRPNETVEFKCYTRHEGGTTWGRWGHVVGLGDNHGGTKRLVRARLAWRVDVAGKKFEPLTGQTVTCDTTGYEN